MGLVLPSLLGLSSLRKLDLRNCNLLDGGLPSDIGCLPSLEILDLSGNNFVRLPDISRLSRLEILRVIGCKWLAALPELPSNMNELFANNCRSLKSLAEPSTKYLSLRHIGLTNCLKLLKNQRSKDIASILLRHVLQGLGYYDCRFGIVVPGGEIPEWFGYQNSGGELFMQLPPDWNVKNFMGLAVCFVSEFTTAKHIGVHLKLGAPDGVKLGKSFCMGFHRTKFKISSEHVWLGYVSADFFDEWTLPEDCCLLELSIRKENLDEGEFRIKNCAARLVYEEDTNVSAEAVAEHNDGAEVSGSGSCDDDDDNNDNVDNDDDVDDDRFHRCFCYGSRDQWQWLYPWPNQLRFGYKEDGHRGSPFPCLKGTDPIFVTFRSFATLLSLSLCVYLHLSRTSFFLLLRSLQQFTDTQQWQKNNYGFKGGCVVKFLVRVLFEPLLEIC
ncbi:hypothetical protein F0562_008024 [Nyssa sinensis]|uniref:C-JID domain-containing protein n=1 Tax=Nyssa sinensis TaxID=561372 RepID=A0A5J5AA04_9ASTE|nr:hypothetical protein F0562_008024 [Nyssa sinensis]